ncbi:hypothetical protein [Hymenobacter terrigena]
MSEVALKLAEAVELLHNSIALKRESGAKRLRKLGLPESGEILLEALKKEIKDKRTWSARYHIIAALGVVKYLPALPFLWELTHQDFDATMTYLGLGDAIVRLSILEKPLSEVWAEVLKTQNPMFIDGALRAIALLKLVPDDETIQDIIAVARQPEFIDGVRGYPGDKSGLRYWVAAASSGWKKSLTHEFLLECQLIKDTSLKHAADQALKGKYLKWDY